VATTQSWDEGGRSSNNLYVLNDELGQVGEVEDLARGESIYAVRFMGERAYVVTFKQVDPLFVLDLSNPRQPKVLGELKIPGYSNYLHPIDRDHVLGIGKEVDPTIDADKVHSDDAVYYTAIQGVKLSVFDVSDVTKPRELFKEVIGERGTESPVLTNHRALLYEPERELLALPISVAKLKAGPYGSEPQTIWQGAYVYQLNLDDGFVLRGRISHVKDPDATKPQYWYAGDDEVQRIVRIGTSLYTLSNDWVQAHSEVTLRQQGSVEVGE
jgi:inhibitor of cysteine peptidase